jgi:uncharacterized membrane protein YjjB (DUF3815 family)
VVALQRLELGRSEVQHRSATPIQQYILSLVSRQTSHFVTLFCLKFFFGYLNSKFNIATLYSLGSSGHLYSRRLQQLEATAEYKSFISLLPCNAVRQESIFFCWGAYRFTRRKRGLSVLDNVKFDLPISHIDKYLPFESYAFGLVSK